MNTFRALLQSINDKKKQSIFLSDKILIAKMKPT